MTPVGFEPTQLALVELESTPLDHSGNVSVIETVLRIVFPKVGFPHPREYAVSSAVLCAGVISTHR